MISPNLQPLATLHDRLSKKIEQGRAIQLSPNDLDWLVISGAYAALLEYVAREAFDASKRRLEAAGHDLSFFERQADAVPVPAFEPAAIAPAPGSEREIFSPAQIAERWAATSTHVIGQMKAGALRHFKIGPRVYRSRHEDVEAFEKDRGIGRSSTR